MQRHVVCISDTHNSHRDIKVPDGDILIHAGDVSWQGEREIYKDIDAWFATLPHRYKIIVAGNHDFDFYAYPWKHATPLFDGDVSVLGLHIWGSPITPHFGSWAYMADRGASIKRHWDRIPMMPDIVVTHGPAYGILDKNRMGESCGCEELEQRLRVVRPMAHVCGHIHGGYGVTSVDGITRVNASTCNEDYMAVNVPIILPMPIQLTTGR